MWLRRNQVGFFQSKEILGILEKISWRRHWDVQAYTFYVYMSCYFQEGNLGIPYYFFYRGRFSKSLNMSILQCILLYEILVFSYSYERKLFKVSKHIDSSMHPSLWNSYVGNQIVYFQSIVFRWLLNLGMSCYIF